MYVVWNITICGVVVVSGHASHKTKMFAVVFLATVMVRMTKYIQTVLTVPGIPLCVLPRVGNMDLPDAGRIGGHCHCAVCLAATLSRQRAQHQSQRAQLCMATPLQQYVTGDIECADQMSR